MEKQEIKIIKWGIVFFGDPGLISFNDKRVEITKTDGNSIFNCAINELKKANYNSNNGMIVLKSTDGRKCAFTFKEDEPAQQLGNLLDKAGVKGFNV